MGITVTLSQFRSEQSHYLDAAQGEPVTISSRGPRRRAVVVSPDFGQVPCSGVAVCAFGSV
ncbi:type II toxin-antitoxin system prevent-host-death family antitoxin [Corynebacterium lehmanniae]|nr:type II toxin-antitoxin system prevent-host-death family antitoxin [Corynebacterium lehmanniae]